MTSTFPTSRSSSQSLKNGLREIQLKKETLMTLEIALKKRINEFRELCLKEGELTGHLPVDYPLQPREPIPQVRRRLTRSNGNIPHELLTSNSIMQTGLRSQLHRLTPSSTSSTISAEDSLKIRLQSVEEPTRLGSPSNNLINIPQSEDSTKIVNLNGVTNFQPYYEETKPFQMSDFYKYSSKLKQANNKFCTKGNETNSTINKTTKSSTIQTQLPTRPPRSHSTKDSTTQQKQLHPKQRTHIEQTLHQFSTNCDLVAQAINNRPKTTRQLQEDVAKMQSHIRMASYDDQILASKRLIERSGQKLIEATAKAIAGNPSLAERLNTLLPQHNGTTERY